jgi:1-acyl-sn-glycerol-3-phosphate acyltransferase
VCLWGSEKIVQKGKYLPKLTPLTIRIGQPIAPPKSSDRAELTAITQQCAETINAMHDLGR